jgi:hypothetical protein
MIYLVYGDPSGLICLDLIKKKIAPEEIFVWDDDSRHHFRIKQISDRINIVKDINLIPEHMHFDTTIGNPPYKGTLHLEFLLKALELSDNVSLVHPSGWLCRKRTGIEQTVINALKNRVCELELFNGNARFPDATFGAPLVITTVKKSHTGPIKLTYETTGNTYYLNSLDDMPSGYWEPTPIHLETVAKFKNLCQTSSIFDLLKKYTGTGAALSTPRTCGHANIISTPRVCGNQTNEENDFFSYDFYTFFYRNSDIHTISPKRKVFQTSSVEECDSLISYLKTKVARFGLSISKVSQDVHISYYLKNVPLPPLDRDWTEESIMDYYEFTQEQRDLINTFIKDYYNV